MWINVILALLLAFGLVTNLAKNRLEEEQTKHDNRIRFLENDLQRIEKDQLLREQDLNKQLLLFAQQLREQPKEEQQPLEYQALKQQWGEYHYHGSDYLPGGELSGDAYD